MGFWETLWASLWGALAGAAVGSVAAWGFALDLRRRQSRADYDDKLNAAIGALSSAVRLVARTKRSSPWKRLGIFRRNRIIVDEEIVINATEAAMVVANSDDMEVLRMFETRMDFYFKGFTWQGRLDQLYAAMRARGLATEEQILAWARTTPPLRLAFSFWSSWERTPLQSVSVLLSWRRGDITRAEAIRRLDPSIFPVYDLDSADNLEDWSGSLRYGHWAPKAIRAQYREQERAAPYTDRVN